MVDNHRRWNVSDGPPSVKNAAETNSDGRDDGIAWGAARIILTRLVAEPSYVELDAGLRVTIERFLERHPAMGTPGAR
jgi:hypothetical protein